MAKLSRFDTFLNNDYSWSEYNRKEYVPDLAMYEQQLQALSAEKEKADSFLKSKIPNYIPKDEAVALDLIKQYNNFTTDIESAYADKGVAYGKRALRDVLRQVERDASPGGVYHGLEQRYKQYGDLLKQYDDVLKDSPGQYKEAVLNKLRGNIPEFKNEVTGSVNPINDPGYGKWQDIGGDLMKLLDGFESDKGTIIQQGGRFIYKNTTEQVSDADVQRAAQQLLAQPKYSQQLGIEAESYQPTETDIAEHLVADLPQDASNLQKELKRLGYYTGKIDSKIGSMTQQAIKDYIEDKIAKEGVDVDQIGLSKIMDSYISPVVNKYGFTKTTKDQDTNPYGLAEYTHSLKLKEIDAENYNPLLGLSFPSEKQTLTDKDRQRTIGFGGVGLGYSMNQVNTNIQQVQGAVTGIRTTIEKNFGYDNASDLFSMDDATINTRHPGHLNEIRTAQHKIKMYTKVQDINKTLLNEADTYAVQKAGLTNLTKPANMSWSDYLNINGAKVLRDKYEEAVNGYIENAVKEQYTRTPEIFTTIPVRDKDGNLSQTASKNATAMLDNFVSNPINLASFNYRTADGVEVAFTTEEQIENMPRIAKGLPGAGNIDWKATGAKLIGVEKTPNPAYGGSYVMTVRMWDAAGKPSDYTVPAPIEVDNLMRYGGQPLQEDGNIKGNSGNNIRKEAEHLAQSLIGEAKLQPARTYATEYGVFYKDKNPKTGERVSEPVFMAKADGEVYVGSDIMTAIGRTYAYQQQQKGRIK